MQCMHKGYIGNQNVLVPLNMKLLFSFGQNSRTCSYKIAQADIMYEDSPAETAETLYTTVMLTLVSTAGMQTFEESFISVKLDYLVPTIQVLWMIKISTAFQLKILSNYNLV